MYPYERLRSANVLGTLKAIKFACQGRPKQFIFVSSTSAIDTEYYIRLSESSLREGKGGVSEDDTLEGSRTGLKTGYGQSKWVSEKLLFEAGKRGLRGYIVRPGYIVGDAETAGALRVRSVDCVCSLNLSKPQSPTRTILSGASRRDAFNLDLSLISTILSTWFQSTTWPSVSHWLRYRPTQPGSLSFMYEHALFPHTMPSFLLFPDTASLRNDANTLSGDVS